MEYVVGLGSNLGSRRANLAAALAWLELSGIAEVARVSALYDNEPFGPPQPRYFNAAARVTSALLPHAFLDALLAIEARFGRVRRERWGARTLDLDILWASARVHDDVLTIPHARLTERSFALAPLLDVAPELAAEYGPRLAALGGAPAQTLAWQGVSRVQRAPHALEISAEGPDFAEALADALGALGRALGAPQRGAGAPGVERVEVPSAGEAAALVETLLSHAARGFAPARVVLGEARDGAREARLIGYAGRPATDGWRLGSASQSTIAPTEPAACLTTSAQVLISVLR